MACAAPPPIFEQPRVLLLQDVHLNVDAQRAIAARLQHDIENGTLKTIGVEGAFAPFDTSLLKILPPKKLQRHALRYFEQARLAAPSLACLATLKRPVRFVGVDDRDHYARNLNALHQARRLQPILRTELTRRRARLDSNKHQLLPPALYFFDVARTDYHAGRTSLTNYVNFLTETLPSSFAWPTVLTKFRNGLALEEQLRGRLEKAKRGSNVDVAEVETLARRHADALSSIETVDISLALMNLEQRAIAQLTTSPTQRALLKQSRRLALIEKLVSFSLTPQEWLEYRTSNTVAPALAAFERFYVEADARSERMADNLLAASGNGSAALVVGGFHTPYLVELFRRRGIACDVVTPSLKSASVAHATDYLARMLAPETVNISYAPLEHELVTDTIADVSIQDFSEYVLAPAPEPPFVDAEPASRNDGLSLTERLQFLAEVLERVQTFTGPLDKSSELYAAQLHNILRGHAYVVGKSIPGFAGLFDHTMERWRQWQDAVHKNDPARAIAFHKSLTNPWGEMTALNRQISDANVFWEFEFDGSKIHFQPASQPAGQRTAKSAPVMMRGLYRDKALNDEREFASVYEFHDGAYATLERVAAQYPDVIVVNVDPHNDVYVSRPKSHLITDASWGAAALYNGLTPAILQVLLPSEIAPFAAPRFIIRTLQPASFDHPAMFAQHALSEADAKRLLANRPILLTIDADAFSLRPGINEHPAGRDYTAGYHFDPSGDDIRFEYRLKSLANFMKTCGGTPVKLVIAESGGYLNGKGVGVTSGFADIHSPQHVDQWDQFPGSLWFDRLAQRLINTFPAPPSFSPPHAYRAVPLDPKRQNLLNHFREILRQGTFPTGDIGNETIALVHLWQLTRPHSDELAREIQHLLQWMTGHLHHSAALHVFSRVLAEQSEMPARWVDAPDNSDDIYFSLLWNCVRAFDARFPEIHHALQYFLIHLMGMSNRSTGMHLRRAAITKSIRGTGRDITWLNVLFANAGFPWKFVEIHRRIELRPSDVESAEDLAHQETIMLRPQYWKKSIAEKGQLVSIEEFHDAAYSALAQMDRPEKTVVVNIDPHHDVYDGPLAGIHDGNWVVYALSHRLAQTVIQVILPAPNDPNQTPRMIGWVSEEQGEEGVDIVSYELMGSVREIFQQFPDHFVTVDCDSFSLNPNEVLKDVAGMDLSAGYHVGASEEPVLFHHRLDLIRDFLQQNGIRPKKVLIAESPTYLNTVGVATSSGFAASFAMPDHPMEWERTPHSPWFEETSERIKTMFEQEWIAQTTRDAMRNGNTQKPAQRQAALAAS